MAELHVIGQIVGASGFAAKKLFCVWEISSGGAWTAISGDKDGQTQVDRPEIDDFALWSHPLDVHFATKGIQGWPKISFQVWSVDNYNRSEMCAYGFCNIPSTPGEHKVECETWRPVGGLRDRIITFFLGGGPQLRDLNVVHNGLQRHRLYTKSMGKVYLQIGVLMRGFEKFGVEFS
ncbi:B9 domain-containing protein 2-like [Paramacrobiotus metropolitanus]|uniref:B9 domain-containing protein 2-like n=1 Tax=Paramacrobiotus metropolitanus TaxID=2943436 RepID=UPI00244567CE|nr:B9 domain-containing protein 2-like [Paramacrobiotus metropolitanus]